MILNYKAKMDRRPNRSSAYQHLMVETSCSSEMLESFSNNDGIYSKLNPFKYNEEIVDLEDQLKLEFWRVVEKLLTSRQRDVIRLYADGYTQMEIAKILNVNQSSITKSLNGNVDYKKGKVIYGGSKKKIRKIIEGDEKIREILNKISELRESEY